MKNNLIIYFCFGILVLLGIHAITQMLNPDKPLTNIERIVQIRDDSITYWRDKYLREHAEKRLAEGRIEELQLVYGPLIDSVKSALDIQSSAIKYLTAVGVSTSGTVTTKVDTFYVDSAQHVKFSYSDRWLSLSGTLSDLIHLKYTTRDSLVITGYTKNDGFLGLGKRETFIDAYSLNPNSKITGLTGMMVLKERQKRFGLGPYVGIGWTGGGFVPAVGVGLHYSLIKF